MRTHGKRSAAASRITNNSLTYGVVPKGMSEAEQMRRAVGNSMKKTANGPSPQYGGEIYDSNDKDDPAFWEREFTHNHLSDLSSKKPADRKAPAPQPPPDPSRPTPAAAAAEEEDETPAVVKDVREHINSVYVVSRSIMSKTERKRNVLVSKALSRPHNPEYVNLLKSMKDKPTLEMADTIMDYAEDMEED